MASRILTPAGHIVARSKNLRGLTAHARRAGPPVSVHLYQHARESAAYPYGVQVFYADGTRGVTSFADWRVCADWLASRRSWRGARVCGLSEFVERYQRRTGVNS
jgi:hypothetical protein